MHKRQKIIRLFSVVLVLFVLGSAIDTGSILSLNASNSSAAAKSRLDDLQKELESIRKRIADLNKSISEGKNIAELAKAKQVALQQEAKLLEEQIVIKKAEIARQEELIELKTIEIAKKQDEYDESDRLFRQRLIAIYKMNNSSILSTLLGVTSFSEFLTLSKNLQMISKNDSELLDMLAKQRAELESAKAELDTLLASLVAERTEMDQKRAEYDRSIAEQAALASQIMAAIAAEEAELAQLYKERQEAQNALEQIWAQLGISGNSGEYIGGAIGWPVPAFNGQGYITSGFGWRTLYGRPNYHAGIDISGPSAYGTSIVSANAGTVVYVVSNSNVGYGNYVIVDHYGGVKTLYAHMASVSVSYGQFVGAGQEVGRMGSTGNSTGPHLHFELRLNNTEKTNPLPYLSGQKSL